MALDTLYQLRHVQEFDGQEIENVYFFNRSAGTGDATQLCIDFESVFLPSIQLLQVAGVHSKKLVAYNLGVSSDFQTLPLAVSGLYGDVPAKPSFVAVGYTFNPDTRAVRKGGKRIAGVPTEVANNNEITSSSYLADMEGLRLIFAAPLTVGGNTWQSVMVKRTKTLVAGTVPPKYKYALPVASDPLVIAGIRSVATSPFLTSQVSRKQG